MSIYKRSVFFIFGLVLVVSCSTNKDRFVNRNFHAVTAEYNILYNGNIALEEGKEEVAISYTDNYWEILPVERMQLSEKVMLPGQSKNEKFQRAETKAAKAIQKHGMYIDGRERNPQMDEAFLLLGKARYYDQRFIPALEAFNYILSRYPTSNNIAHANIWREKTNIRLNNNELAIKNLKEILKRENSLEEQDIADASAMLAQAYINIEALDSAVVQIDKAAELTEKDDEKGRYLFIKAQLLNNLGEIEKANAAFDEVIALNRKAPRVYMINAYIEKAKNFDFEQGNPNELLAVLEELAADRENRPFLDIIYHQLGEFYRKTGDTRLAVDYYNKSLRTRSKNQYLHAQNYKIIGNINFDAKEYQLASAYFDSTLTKLEENTHEFRRIKKKRDNLSDVVLYETIANRNDSILKVAKLSEKEQYVYFTNYINELKNEDEIAKEALGNETETSIETSTRNISAMGATPSSFYFYNEAAVGYGLMEFKRIWGDIELTDNWRFAPVERRKVAGNETEAETDSIKTELDPKYHVGTYIAQVPTDPKVLDSLEKERNFAYYQLGVIYKEKLDENALAIERFEALLKNDPEERLVLPSKYNLYQLYQEVGNSGKAELYKNDILNNHSDSRYAAILRNPESLLKEENKPATIYANLYEQLNNEKYQAVIDSSEIYITRFNGDPIVPKLEFLKARAKARLFGFDAYKEGINFIALNYPQSEEGKKAQELYKNVIPELEFKTFESENNESDFKLVFPFSENEKDKAILFEEKLKEAIAELSVEGLETSVDIYNPEQQFVVIHKLKSALGAKGLAEKLSKLKKDPITRTSFPISTANYELVQMHKNLDTYLKSKK